MASSDENELKDLYITYSPMYFEKYLNNPKKYGKRVKDKRLCMNLSVRRLADEIGISHSQVSKIENGNAQFINLGILQSLSEKFDCSPLYLLGKSDFEKPSLENYCYTNPWTNNKLLETWYMCIHKSTERKIFLKNKWIDLSDVGMRNLITLAKQNKNGIKVKLDNQMYYITYLVKERYIKNSVFRKEKYVENKLFNEYSIEKDEKDKKKENIITKTLPKEKDFFTHKNLNDFLVIQPCSDIQNLAQKIDNKYDNILYMQKVNEIFQEKFFVYKNRHLIDYLFELDNVKFDQNKIIKHLSLLLHTKEFDSAVICQTIDNLLVLDESDIQKVVEYINSLLTKHSL